MSIGSRNRATHSNNVNEHSSRSHLVLSVQIAKVASQGGGRASGDGADDSFGELNLIDLALHKF